MILTWPPVRFSISCAHHLSIWEPVVFSVYWLLIRSVVSAAAGANPSNTANAAVASLAIAWTMTHPSS
ncbi:MAG: hypothetical protein ACOZDY_03240 [Pseudomonadota bacterium]